MMCRMQRLVETTFAAALDGVDTAPLTMFFASDLGQRIIKGELSTRLSTWRMMSLKRTKPPGAVEGS